jgi:hypothetical protein
MSAPDSYWDDDSSDPMPSHAYTPSSFPVLRDDAGSIDKDAIMDCFRRDVDAWLLDRRKWWKRRIARERQQERPHPDTETIASNAEIDAI